LAFNQSIPSCQFLGSPKSWSFKNV
jgi:hypothetical protein